MPHSRTIAAPLLGCLVFGCLVFGFAAQPAHAQYMYVGYDNNQDFTTPGSGLLNASGTQATGNYSFVNADPTTTGYLGLTTYNTSLLTITGGTFQQLAAGDSSFINLIGSNLTLSADFQFPQSGGPYYTISGLLQGDSTPFTAQYYAPSTGTLEFDGTPAVPGAAPVPEASTTISLGLLLMLGTGWTVVKRRKVVVSV